MFKKINNKLLSQYPLLWNTKILVFLPATLLIHFLFYLAGLVHPISIKELYISGLFQDSQVVLFSVLVTVLLIIFWLVFYLRNNPFKSYYTLSRTYLFKEFLLLFVVFFTSSTFFLSYKQGFYDNINLKTKHIDLKKEADIYNLSQHFIAFNEEHFDTRYRCDSVDIRALRDSIWEVEHPSNYNNYNMNSSTVDYPKEEQYDNPQNRPQEGYLFDDSTYFPKSYLNYCKENEITIYAENGILLSMDELNVIAEKWLKEYKKDSVLYVLSSFKNLCSQYGITNKFNPQNQLLECFNDSLFSVKTIYQNSYNEYNYNKEDYESNDYYIHTYHLETSLERIDKVRYGFWDKEILFFMFYYALGASLFLFSFRISRLKNWFISIVATGVLSIIISLYVAFTNIHDLSLIYLLFFLWTIFFISSIFMIKNQSNKLVSSVFFNWSFWFLSFIIPFIFILIYDYTRVDCQFYIDTYKVCPDPPMIHTWIDKNWTVIHIINCFFVLLSMYFVFIPLVRKWQSNPEE